MKFFSVLVGVLFAATVLADDLACSTGCLIPLESALFAGDDPSLDYYVMACLNNLRVSSFYVCLRNRCTQKEIDIGIKQSASDCMTYGSVSLLPYSIIDNITKADEANFTVLSQESPPQVYDTPVVVDDGLFELAYRTGFTWNESLHTRASYSYAMYGFWGVVILIGIINRIYNMVVARVKKTRLPEDSSSEKSAFGSVHTWTRANILEPALFRHRTAQAWGWCTIPPRIESLTLIAFLVINVVLNCVSYDVFTGNLYWPRTDTQLWRYIADRSGCISMANMPLMWAFAMRNNVLIWLTGWSFTRYNQFHRWVSRIATVEAVLHSVAYTVEAFQSGGKAEYVLEWSERYWWMGGIATIVMCLMIGFSILPLRRRAYEFFLSIHIALAIVFLIGMYYHVEIFAGEYNGYIWPCVAVWAFDRFLRLARLIYLNVSARKSTIAYNPESNVIRLNVSVRPGLRLRPGSYYYVYALHGFKAWESHPFSLSSWTTADDESSTKVISFAIRPYDGFTNRLRQLAVRNQDKESNNATPETSVRVVVEGPYGSTHDICNYDSALLVIGGSGISVALSHIQAVHEAMINNRHVKIKRVHLIWAVRNRAMFKDVFDREFSRFGLGGNGVAGKIEFPIDLHVTSVRSSKASLRIGRTEPLEKEIGAGTIKTQIHSTDDQINSISSESESLTEVSPHVNIHDYRPDVVQCIVDEARVRAVSGKTMTVICCGPHSMADDGRAGVVEALSQGCHGVDYKPELFNW